jgi:hypothetical protein
MNILGFKKESKKEEMKRLNEELSRLKLENEELSDLVSLKKDIELEKEKKKVLRGDNISKNKFVRILKNISNIKR